MLLKIKVLSFMNCLLGKSRFGAPQR